MQHIGYQGEKFKEFVKNYKVIDSDTKLFRKIKMEEVAEMLGVSRNQVYKYFNTEYLDDKVVVRIMSAFEVGVEEIWGDIGKKIQIKDINKSGEDSITDMLMQMQNTIDKALIDDKILKQEVTPIPTDAYMMVEYVDLSASAGILGGSNVDLLPETKKRLVPKEFEKGNYLVVRVNGDSMVDGTDISIPDGAEILVKEYILEKGEKLPIRGNLFVICSREGNVFKQIVEHNSDLGYLRCRSYNKKYSDYNIPLDDVFQIFIYRKIVGYRPSIPEI
ncbi:LexA family transcriptional regulator [Sphingobacterium sp. ML3W]|uniref:LexA family transcriptional regulator n=1 Tax=Sphingobacterium sp. ML3W TaxID=1538644 RepID=UPI00249BCDCA|nr:LexA family transcriptional regulator [Sphingobacterium sp. ML3W]WFA79708.1 LexA family transcriptional regulator [Sphingobacterium sp. ML3W]